VGPDQADEVYRTKVLAGTELPRQVGNTYSASLYMSLASALDSSEQLTGTALLFSYGSGLTSTMFGLRLRNNGDTAHQRFTLRAIRSNLRLKPRLMERTAVSPQTYLSELLPSLERRDEHRRSTEGQVFQPQANLSSLQPGTFYLERIEADGVSRYSQTWSDLPASMHPWLGSVTAGINRRPTHSHPTVLCPIPDGTHTPYCANNRIPIPRVRICYQIRCEHGRNQST
jgi:hypothetical protein